MHGGDAQGAALAASYGHALVERGAPGGFQFGGAEEVGTTGAPATRRSEDPRFDRLQQEYDRREDAFARADARMRKLIAEHPHAERIDWSQYRTCVREPGRPSDTCTTTPPRDQKVYDALWGVGVILYQSKDKGRTFYRFYPENPPRYTIMRAPRTPRRRPRSTRTPTASPPAPLGPAGRFLARSTTSAARRSSSRGRGRGTLRREAAGDEGNGSSCATTVTSAPETRTTVPDVQVFDGGSTAEEPEKAIQA